MEKQTSSTKLYPASMVYPREAPVQLQGSRCTDCGTTVFPASERCPGCVSDNVSRIPLDSEGTLYSFSVIHAAPKNFPVPYVVGYVDLPQGVRIFGQVEADPKSLRIDMRVRVNVYPEGKSRDGAPLYGFNFRPA
ncbi:MAG: OB-fold domain-containing protein [Betaproteobacteria bacterium]|nr:OB-fold domain-containing protein [Betaproteobacteria bacterium]